MSNSIASYTFLPWLRQGIASQIKTTDTLGAASGVTLRAGLKITLDVNGEPVSNDVELVGPGDVIGINPAAVVRTEPRHWITDFEPNYLAFMEFYDEDFPWRYTPAKATSSHRLRPWIFVVALEEHEFDVVGVVGAPLPTLRLKGDPADRFPESNQTWGWAHVHVSKDITQDRVRTPTATVDALQDLIGRNPDEASSRLLCPRKLKRNTAYHAFLIPTFETGRLAGLGKDPSGVDAQKPSWGEGQTDYPIYYRWYFHTGDRGDFEYLVNLLEPRPVDDRVGIRDMDMSQPGFEVPPLEDPPVLGLEGALRKPGLKSRPEIWPPTTTPAFVTQLQEKVNLNKTIQEPPTGDGHPDPVVSPPLYGRWHAMVETMAFSASGWVNEMNGDPRLRVPGGFGTEAIQTQQEKYMKQAWEQLGDVLAANQKIRQVQLSVAAVHRIFERNLVPLEAGDLLALTQSVHPRVMGSPTTIAFQVKESRLPPAALHPTFRRLLRTRGPVMRKAVPEEKRKPAELVSQLGAGKIFTAPPKRAPEGQIDTRTLPVRLPLWVPNWLRGLLRSNLVRLLLIILLVALVVLTLLLGAPILLIVLTILTAAVLVAYEILRWQVEQPGPLQEETFRPETVDAIPFNPGFSVTVPGDTTPPLSAPGAADSPDAARFRAAVTDLFDRFSVELPQEAPRPAFDLSDATTKLLAALNPVLSIPKRALSVIAIPGNVKYLRSFTSIVPVMAHPVFLHPMYKPLRNISSELLIPNLNLIPNNTISLLETNRKFIEAYMVGLNHEMGRELLWREYPTDQRGSYFRQFWDVSDVVTRDPSRSEAEIEESLKDIKPIHTWHKSTELGTHENRNLPSGAEPGETRLVLVIRGDLLKKYPTAVIYAQKAKWIDNPHPNLFRSAKIRVLDESEPEKNLQEPIFKAEIEPEIKFLGFNLTASKVKGKQDPDADDPGWFFVIQERPGEPRFGMDIQDTTPPPPTEWNQLAWNHLGNPDSINYIDLTTAIATGTMGEPDSSVTWGSNAADMGYILYQVPVMVAFHAQDMLE